MVHKMLNSPDRPRAIFAYSDIMALGVLQAAKQLKLRVPEDVAVMGFDDIEVSEYVGLSTVSQSLLESGRIAADLLIDMIQEPNRPHQKISLYPKIIERDTTSGIL